MDETYRVTEYGVLDTAVGPALRVQIERVDRGVMGFRELWDVFEAKFPGMWAVQLFPPRAHMFDQANRYHLHVVREEPTGLDLFGDALPDPDRRL